MTNQQTVLCVCRAYAVKSRVAASALFIAVIVSAHAVVANGQKDQPFYRVKPAPSSAPSSISQQYEKEGIAVEFSLKSLPGQDGKDPGLVAGADAVVLFRLTDKGTGQP